MEDGRGEDDPLEIARGAAKEAVLDLLREAGPASARKVLVAEETLARPLSLVVHGEDLMYNGVDPYIHPLSRVSRLDESVEVVVFLVRSVHPEMMGEVEKWMHEDSGDPSREDERSYVVAFVPGRSAQCIERLGGANVTVLDCNLHFFPVGDVLSMEMPGVFRDYHVRGDPSSLFVAATALQSLETLLGTPPVVHYLGAAAKAAAEIQNWPEHGSGRNAAVEPTLDEAIVIDRRVDLVSILCSTFTYEALVDDCLGIEGEFVDLSSVEGVKSDLDLAHPDWKPHCPKCAQVMERSDERGASVPEYAGGWRCENVHICGRTGSKEQEEGRAIRWKCGKSSCKTDFCRRCGKQVRLSPSDSLYSEIRDVHIDELQSFMNTWVDQVQALNEECKQTADARDKASIMNQSFKQNAAANMHMVIAKCITSTKKTEQSAAAWKAESLMFEGLHDQLSVVEDLIYEEGPLLEVFRLLCLHSLINGGVQKAQLESMQRAVLHAYGHRQALTFAALERCGLLRVYDGQWPQAGAWQRLSHDFKLKEAEGSQGIGRAANGRVPLSVRFVEHAVEKEVPGGDYVGPAERRLAVAARTGGPAGWRARREAVDLVGPASSMRRHAGKQVADGAEPPEAAAAYAAAVRRNSGSLEGASPTSAASSAAEPSAGTSQDVHEGEDAGENAGPSMCNLCQGSGKVGLFGGYSGAGLYKKECSQCLGTGVVQAGQENSGAPVAANGGEATSTSAATDPPAAGGWFSRTAKPGVSIAPPIVPLRVLVVFLGGVTYGELAALRQLEASEGGRRKFLVATTEILGARRLLASMGCEDPAVFDNGGEADAGRSPADSDNGGNPFK